MSGKLASVLQPAKFLLMILQVIFNFVILEVSDQHIFVTTPTKTDPSYTVASKSLSFWCWVSIIALAVEFGIIFSGRTLFNDKYNLIVIGVHITGLFITGAFVNSMMDAGTLTRVFVVSSLVPVGIEALSFQYS